MFNSQKIVNTQLIAYLQNENKTARVAHTTEKLRKMYAEALFERLFQKQLGVFTMRNQKGVWHLSLLQKGNKITAQGKTLAHAVIALSVKNGFTFNTQSV